MRFLVFCFLFFEIPLKSSEKSVLANHEEKVIVALTQGLTISLKQFFDQYGSDTHNANYKNIEKLSGPDFMKQFDNVVNQYPHTSGYRPNSINIDIQIKPTTCRLVDSYIVCDVSVFNFYIKWKRSQKSKVVYAEKLLYNLFTPYLVFVFNQTDHAIRFNGIYCFDPMNSKVKSCNSQ